MSIDQGGIALENIDAKPNRNEYKEWIKMNHEDMLKAQANGTLIGYHPGKGLGLVKPQEKTK
jgi:hypothetical protein